MLFLFFIFGLVSIGLVVFAAGATIIGIILATMKATRSFAPFVLIPILGAVSALLASWGLSFAANSASTNAASVDALERWQVLAIWAWPFGLTAGGILGLGLGAGIAIALWRLIRGRVEVAA